MFAWVDGDSAAAEHCRRGGVDQSQTHFKVFEIPLVVVSATATCIETYVDLIGGSGKDKRARSAGLIGSGFILLLVEVAVVVVKLIVGDVCTFFLSFVMIVIAVREELIMRIAHHTRFFTQYEASLVK